MSRLNTSFVLGYHGCDAETANKIVCDGAPLLKSDRDYDWLGPGAYFWERDPDRAWEWAVSRSKHSRQTPAVVGAVIDLGNCLDLTTREGVAYVTAAFSSFERLHEKSGLPLPQNKNGKGGGTTDILLRYLDCAVLRHLHSLVESDPALDAFDSVRGLFVEGATAFPGAEIRSKTHTQIAVLNDDCIKGLFYPLIHGKRQF